MRVFAAELPSALRPDGAVFEPRSFEDARHASAGPLRHATSSKAGKQAPQDAAQLREALKECNCFEELRQSPCWVPLAAAFQCYTQSTAHAKGEECALAFKAVHHCMLANLKDFRSTVKTDEDLELLKDFRGRVFS